MSCRLYVDEKLTTVGHSLEGARRLAAPYIPMLRVLKIEICEGSAPTQVWAYDYGIEAWVLQEAPVAKEADGGHGLRCNAIATRHP